MTQPFPVGPEQGPPPPHIAEARQFAEAQFSDFREADMQFNIGRVEGSPPRGLDIIVGRGEETSRYYVTQGTDLSSEANVLTTLGHGAVLMPTRHDSKSDVTIYRVPKGARLIGKTLHQAPYNPDYMNRLSYRFGTFMSKLRRLDTGLFGISLLDVAVTHEAEGSRDGRAGDVSIELAVVPPLAAADQLPGVSDEELVNNSSWIFATDAQREYFQKGLRGE
jgi:hypothetical protein